MRARVIASTGVGAGIVTHILEDGWILPSYRSGTVATQRKKMRNMMRPGMNVSSPAMTSPPK